MSTAQAYFQQQQQQSADWFAQHQPAGPAPATGQVYQSPDGVPQTGTGGTLGRTDPSQITLSPGQGGAAGTGSFPLPNTTATDPGGVYAGDPNAYVQRLIHDLGLTASQTDPAALRVIVGYLQRNGVNAQMDAVDSNGHLGGILIDGQPMQLIDGSNRWTNLQPWTPGGGSSLDPLNPDPTFGTPATPYASRPLSDFTAPYSTPAVPDALAQPFRAPTLDEAMNTPGYQFGLQQGQQGLQRSAAAQGTILNGGTEKALDRYTQDYADTNYQRVYANALGTRQQNQGEYQQAVGNFNTEYQNRYASYLGDNATTLGDYLTNYNAQRAHTQDYYNLYLNPAANRDIQGTSILASVR